MSRPVRRKAYETHELAYRRMRARGQTSWDEFAGAAEEPGRQITADLERFLADVLARPWAPRSGQALELGCGTAPILRWLNDRGFRGLGVDVSRTAIAMAREQCRGRALRFRRADVCREDLGRPGRFDLVVDGHCLHCIFDPRDRARVLARTRKLLKPGGVLLVSTMCGPVDRRALSRRWKGQHLRSGVVYVRWDQAPEHEGWRRIRGEPCLPTRYIGHWRSILAEVKRAGFSIALFRVAAAGEEPVGMLDLAAIPRAPRRGPS